MTSEPGGWYETPQGVIARLQYRREASRSPDEARFHENGWSAAYHFSPDADRNPDRAMVSLEHVRRNWLPITVIHATERLREWGIGADQVDLLERRIQG